MISVVGTDGGIEKPYKVFSPTIGFAVIRSLIRLTCGREYDTRCFDLSGAFLSGAFLSKELLDRDVYAKLPPDCCELAGKILRLVKSVSGLGTSNSDFYKVLSDSVLKFQKGSDTKTDTVEEERRGSDRRVQVVERQIKRVYHFRKLLTDPCIDICEDDDGNRMIQGHYVDDLIISTTNPHLREEFLNHLRKSWDITDEGILSRFLGTHFTRDREARTWKMSIGI
jgi:hypothetical protein